MALPTIASLGAAAAPYITSGLKGLASTAASHLGPGLAKTALDFVQSPSLEKAGDIASSIAPGLVEKAGKFFSLEHLANSLQNKTAETTLKKHQKQRQRQQQRRLQKQVEKQNKDYHDQAREEWLDEFPDREGEITEKLKLWLKKNHITEEDIVKLSNREALNLKGDSDKLSDNIIKALEDLKDKNILSPGIESQGKAFAHDYIKFINKVSEVRFFGIPFEYWGTDGYYN